MGVKYKYRKEYNFDGTSVPKDIHIRLNQLNGKGILFEYKKPCDHFLQINPPIHRLLFTVTIAAKEIEQITENENKLLELAEGLNCPLFQKFPTVYTYFENGVWQRKEVL